MEYSAIETPMAREDAYSNAISGNRAKATRMGPSCTIFRCQKAQIGFPRADNLSAELWHQTS
jgi:hypothetical protein